MCLITTQDEIKIAERDLVCWKLLELIRDDKGNEITVTPYMFTKIDDDVLKGKATLKAKVTTDYDYHFLPMYGEHCKCVKSNFVHTYRTLKNGVYRIPQHSRFGGFFDVLSGLLYFIGKKDTYCMNPKRRDLGCDDFPLITGVVLYKCVIPKGTEYFAGHDDGMHDVLCYASREIVFKEKVGEWRDSNPPTHEEMIRLIGSDSI